MTTQNKISYEAKITSRHFLILIGVAGLMISGFCIYFTGTIIYPNTRPTIITIFTLGVTLFPSALVLLLYEIFFQRLASIRLLEEMVSGVKESFTPLFALGNTGIRKIYANRGGLPERLAELLKAAGVKKVRFCGVQTTSPEQIPGFEMLLIGLLRSGCIFQFLFMQRDKTQFDFFARRDRDENCVENRDGEILRKGAQNTIERLKGFAGKELNFANNIQLREYCAFPYVSFIQIEDRIFVGPYLYSVPCSEMPMFEIEDNGREDCIFRKYVRHFEQLFINARPII